MASVNKVIILGNLGKDPETRYANSGAAICTFSVATTEKWKDKASGEMREETEWHRVVFFDRLAEIAGEYLSKGKPVYVEGKLKTRKYTDKEGVERYTTEIHGMSMQLLGAREDSDRPTAGYRPTAGKAPPPRQGPAPGPTKNDDDFTDDIPF